jgi:antitoxin component of MazEF toxin-antitoxin module
MVNEGKELRNFIKRKKVVRFGTSRGVVLPAKWIRLLGVSDYVTVILDLPNKAIVITEDRDKDKPEEVEL